MLAPALFMVQEWEAGGHGAATPWWTFGLRALALLAGLVFLFVVARGVVRRRRYLAVEVLTPPDLDAVHEALREAERRTVGEIVPVVVERSDSHPQAETVAALLAVLVGTALLAPDLPWDHPPLLILCQAGFGIAGFLAARLLPDFKRSFISEDRATEMVEEQAFQEFHRLGLPATAGATGVLIFVSLLERRVVVLGDRGIDAVLDETFWTGVSDAILDGIQRGSLRAGLVEGIRRCGAVLAERFPWTAGDRNELPDRLLVRRS